MAEGSDPLFVNWRTGQPMPFSEMMLPFVLVPQQFGATGDGVTDDQPAIQSWWTQVLTTGKAGYIPPGIYRCANNVIWDLFETGTLNSARGVRVFGAGQIRTQFLMDAGFSFNITNTGTTATDAAFYHAFDSFSIIGNINGVLLFYGTGDLDGAFNWCDIQRVYSANLSTGPNNIAIQMQSLFGCLVSVLGNCGAFPVYNGNAIRIVDCNFNSFKLFPGASLIGLDLYASSTTCSGNIFTACDFEVNGTNVRINNANVTNNRFIGGVLAQHLVTDVGIEGVAGSDNVFEGLLSGGLGPLFHATNKVGIIWKNALGPTVVTPAVPASTVALQNTTVQPIMAYINGSVTSIARNGTTIFGAVSSATVRLEPEDTITLVYGAAPTWVWQRAYS